MSVKVDLDKLAEAVADYPFGYLITVGDDHRAHTVAVDPVLTDAVFEIAAVRNNTRRNVTSRTVVTLLWPPRDADGYTLIVDGHGELHDDTLRIRPTHAVLHKKA